MFRSLLRPLSEVTADLAGLVYPDRCRGCDADASGELCDDCSAALDALTAKPQCNQCGRSGSPDGSPCLFCHGKGVRHYDTVLRLCGYEPPVIGLIHRMKFSRRWEIAELLADRLLNKPGIAAAIGGFEVIVPVPMHRWKQVWRGFNPAAEIAHRLGRKTGVRVANVAVRCRGGKPQSVLRSQAARKSNTDHAFAALEPAAVRGRRVLVVDDITTSGATLQAMARALRIARPAGLSAAVIAVAQRGGGVGRRIGS